MKKVLRYLRYFLVCLLGLVLVIGGLFAYFIYTPDPKIPELSGALTKATMEVDGLKRTYRTYLPKGLAKGAPLLVVLHGSGQNGAQIRLETGYEFDRLADQHGFAVVYPNAKSFDWNDCSKVGDFIADGREVDDVKFLEVLVDKLIAEHGFDQSRVFAAGVSSGGFMSMRLALESSKRFRAVAAVSANVPVPDNFKCKSSGSGTSVMIMNGTKDPLVPYGGGESSLFGLFYKGGNVRSSQDSATFFAETNKITVKPVITLTTNAELMGNPDKQEFDRTLWRDESKAEVELVTIYDGGHGMPQPYWKRPRLLGPSPMAPNGPAIIWDFFARQRR
jgi:polyhydroxybutyrate depolymerase